MLVAGPATGQVAGAPASTPADAGVQAELEPGAPALAVQRYRLGRSLYGQGRFAEAAREFEAGLLIFPDSPKLSYNAARSHERAERFADAARAYEDYLRKAPGEQDAAAVAALAEGLWKRANYGRLDLVSTPAGAHVFLDDVAHPLTQVTPAQTRLPAGAHTLRFELEGYAADTRKVVVASGETVAVSLTLTPASSAEVSPASASAKDPARLTASATAPPPGDARAAWPFWLGVSAIGLGAVGVGLGVWSHAQAADASDDARRVGPDTANDAEYARLRADYDDATALGWIGVGAGLGLAAAGVGLLVWDNAQSRVAVGPTGAEVAFVW